MVTVYDLLEVDEKASKEEIEKAYQRLLIEYHKDPKLSEEENNDNEIILNKLKLAYDILINDEKRKKYDMQLSQKRAEELIKNVSIKKEVKEEPVPEVKEESSAEKEIVENNEVYAFKNSSFAEKQEPIQEEVEEEVELTKEEKAKLRKAANKEFKDNLKKAQMAEDEYNKAYNKAYNDYLRKMGYNVKEPWTWKRVKTLLITIVAIILTCIIFWIIPPVRNLLIGIYNENIIVKTLVDLVLIILDAFLGIFKK